MPPEMITEPIPVPEDTEVFTATVEPEFTLDERITWCTNEINQLKNLIQFATHVNFSDGLARDVLSIQQQLTTHLREHAIPPPRQNYK